MGQYEYRITYSGRKSASHQLLDIAEFFEKETNRYALFNKNKPEFSISLKEILQFVGLIFLSGYNIRLSERDYWSTDPDLRCDAICISMSKNCFFEIKAFLHAAKISV